jgi:hypothetical protein
VNRSELDRVASLIGQRNAIDAEIAAVTGRPVAAGHLGEWIASQIFDIELESSAVARDVDGHFRSGDLAGQTVNVKWYGKRENTLDLKPAGAVDVYLVMTGPRSNAASSRGGTRPLCIASVHLFTTKPLLKTLTARGLLIGVASSIRQELWEAAEIYPCANNQALALSPEQREALALFAPR